MASAEAQQTGRQRPCSSAASCRPCRQCAERETHLPDAMILPRTSWGGWLSGSKRYFCLSKGPAWCCSCSHAPRAASKSPPPGASHHHSEQPPFTPPPSPPANLPALPPPLSLSPSPSCRSIKRFHRPTCYLQQHLQHLQQHSTLGPKGWRPSRG